MTKATRGWAIRGSSIDGTVYYAGWGSWTTEKSNAARYAYKPAQPVEALRSELRNREPDETIGHIEAIEHPVPCKAPLATWERYGFALDRKDYWVGSYRSLFQYAWELDGRYPTATDLRYALSLDMDD